MQVIGDRLFVALAKRVGRPHRDQLRECQKLQRWVGRGGTDATLFSLSKQQGLLDPVMAAAFVLLAQEVVERRADYAGQLFDPRPLEASIPDSALASDSCAVDVEPTRLDQTWSGELEPLLGGEFVDRDSREDTHEWNCLLDEMQAANMVHASDVERYRDERSGWDRLLESLESDGLIPPSAPDWTGKSTLDQSSGMRRRLMRVPHTRRRPPARTDARAPISRRARIQGNSRRLQAQHGPPGPEAATS